MGETKILIVVKDGTITDVFSNQPNVEYKIIDHDICTDDLLLSDFPSEIAVTSTIDTEIKNQLCQIINDRSYE